jgi:hypothetical protein
MAQAVMRVTETVAETATVTETEAPGGLAAEDLARSPPGEPPAYDTAREKLGKLCRPQHRYPGTEHSLLYRRHSTCVACDREKTAARRQAKRQGEARSLGMVSLLLERANQIIEAGTYCFGQSRRQHDTALCRLAYDAIAPSTTSLVLWYIYFSTNFSRIPPYRH